MPEILEVESYRRLATRVVGATIERGWADQFLAKKLAFPGAWARAVRGLTVTGVRRRGKLLVLETSGPSLGFRFGMTGVLLLDGEAGIEGLFYGPHAYRPEWVRGGLAFTDGRRLVVHDPRRLARVEVEPDEDELGPDALTLTRPQFERVLHVSRGAGPAIKARLLDQSRISGVGNLLADEALFRAGIDPRTPVGQLADDRRDALYGALRATTRALGRRGGSHTGDHMVARDRDGRCPLDGGEMATATIGGRTTYWCTRHQK